MNLKININLPKDVETLISALTKHGHEAYVVGGCVRDSLLGKTPKDWDITTSATPEEIMQIFGEDNTTKVGIEFGTVPIYLNGEIYEITTFRKESGYSDSRHPDKIEFTNSIKEDLARRDFTINAMAYNPSVGLVDPFGGITDLQNEIIRCVGNPEERFTEDALRILRAIRFSANLGFEIEDETYTEMFFLLKTNALSELSQERITSEFIKIITADVSFEFYDWWRHAIFAIIPELLPTYNFNQHNPYHFLSVFNHTRLALSECKSNDMITKIALLLHDIGKPKCSVWDEEEPNRLHFYGHGEVSAQIANDVLRRMKFDNDTREKIVELVKYHDSQFEVTEKHIRRWLAKIGPEQFERLLDIREADIKAQSPEYLLTRLDKVDRVRKLYQKMMEKEQCFSLKDLAVNGKDLMDLGYTPGKKIGETLNYLLNLVIDGDVDNDKTILLTIASLKNEIVDEQEKENDL